MKKTLLTMAAALALVGCSKSELVETPIQEQNAIAFGTYLGDNAQTRASVVTTETLGVDGFGVNAYYTGQNNYAAGAELNFMQNTKVTYNKGNQKWEYSPVKYWPNNSGDKVSFFAYGPYAKNTGDNNITQNGTSLGFVVPAEVKNQVDLIYNTNYNGTIDQTKPSVEELIHFQFGHALSRISLTVEAAVDEVANGNNLLDGNTRINVKKVALISDTYDAAATSQAGPFYTDGTLSLLNSGTADDGTPNSPWSNLTGSQGFVFNATDHFYHTVKDVDAENMTDDKIDVVQLTRFNASEPQRLLNDDSYLMVIPQEDAEFKIYIEYDVISGGYENNGTGTYDESAITNKITSSEALKVTFEQGKAYNFNLVLGMTSVKVDAAVTEWGDEIDGSEVWLPENSDGTEYIETGTPNSDGMYGSGTQEDPFRISTAEHLSTFNTLVSEKRTYTDAQGATQNYNAAYYMQMCDIDVSPMYNETDGGWNAIDFYGQYDGQNHNIKKLYIKSDNGYLGFIGNLYQGGSISNLNFSDCHIENSKTGTSCQNGACIVASVKQGATVSNCTVSSSTLLRLDGAIASINYGSITGCINYADLTDCASSIVDSNYGIVEKCHNYGHMTMSDENGKYMGGLVYWNSGVIIECSNEGDLANNSTFGYFGGIANTNNGTLIACYNKGSWTLDTYEGGICGDNRGYIIGCYNLTPFSANGTYPGGVVGFNNEEGQVIGCYSKSGNSKIGGLVGLNSGKVLNSYFEISEYVTQGVIRNTGSDYQEENVFGVGSDSVFKWNINGEESTSNAMYTMNKAIEEISESVMEADGWHYEVNTDEATKETTPLVVKYTAPTANDGE